MSPTMSHSVMTLAGQTVRARSVGGIETCIEFPNLNLCFDIGRCPHTAVRLSRVFLTHAHMDHAAGLAWHAATRDLMSLGTPTYYVPNENLDDFEELFRVWRKLDHSDLAVRFVGVSPGDVIALTKHRRVQAFRAVHRVPTLGYAIIETKQKLRPEYAGLSSAEVYQQRLAGNTVSDPVEEITAAFTGDSTIDAFDREELLRKAKLLVMEVTFLDERTSPERTRKTGHIHLDDVLERAELFENEHILFTHFSKRYSPSEIRDIFDRRLPPSLAHRVTLLLPDPDKLPG